MVWVKFESIYTEIDRFGNCRRLENRFEALGSAFEVCQVIDSVMNQVQLPGTKQYGLPLIKDFISDNSSDNITYMPKYRPK